MRFVYDAEGTGFGRKAAASLIDEPSADAYLSELGDEIMLLDGLDYPVGYNTGRAGAMTPPWNDESTYDFGVEGFMLSGTPVRLGMLASGSDYRYTGLGNPRPRGRFGIRARMATVAAASGMQGLGDAAADRARALAIAGGIRATCASACGFATSPADQSMCRSGCDTAYNAAATAIEAAYGGGTSGPTAAEAASIDAKLARLQQAADQAQTGNYAQMQGEDNTVLYVVGGVVVVGLVGVLAYMAARR